MAARDFIYPITIAIESAALKIQPHLKKIDPVWWWTSEHYDMEQFIDAFSLN